MATADTHDQRWRGWDGSGEGETPTVTSGRLPTEVAVQSKLFPKTRSWFALGAPLELLSPLSLVRIVYALALVLLAVEGAAFRWSRPGAAAVMVAVAVIAATWIRLTRVAKLGPQACRQLVTLATVLVLLVVAASPGSATELTTASLLFPLAIVLSFFLGMRSVGGLQLLATTGLTAGLIRHLGVGGAVLATVAWTIAMLSVSLIVQVLMKSVWSSGTVDPETGLPNGLGLVHRTVDRVDDATGTVVVVAAVLLAGVDDARQALGYRVGVELLRRAVEDLGQVVSSDTLITRVEGDELVVTQTMACVPEPDWDPEAGAVPATAVEAGRALADQLAAAISSGRYMVDRVEISLRAHIGLVFTVNGLSDVAELVRRASLSARRAANAGLVCSVWEGDVGTLTADDLALLADLRLAPERGELSLNFQPQVCSVRRQTVGVEALLRWDSPVHGRVPPGRFVILAERTGLIERLTRWVVVEALDAQVRWRAQGVDCPVSVNLSPKTLGLPDLAQWILRALADRDLSSSALTVEVTETAATDLMQAVDLLRPLHDHGIRVSIDDFGTGYTSLAAIPHLPLDEIKVDMSFVKRATSSPADEAIVRSVRELAHRLGLTSVAEGVEDEPLVELMTEIGFDLLQGYHFARPLTEAQLLDHLAGPSTPVPGSSARPAAA